MQDARRAVLVINYNGKDISTDLTKSLIDFSYNDAASGALDDITLNLEDRAQNWQGPWEPTAGDKIKAEIRTINWDKPGEIKKLPLGTFEVDTFDFAGPPDAVAIKAVSLPVSSNVRQERRTKAWEKVNLRTLADEVAKRAGLKLLYEATDNPSYDRLEQAGVSDLAFLLETATKEAIAIKVSGGNLILFDEFEYEKKAPITSITRGESNVINYNFNWSTTLVAYRACEVVYTNSKKKKTYRAAYTPPRAPKTGPILKINEQVDSQAAAIRLARKSLREKNKEAGKGSLTLMGDIRMATGLTITIKGWKRFDGKYIIESCTQSVGSGGYTTSIGIRKVLGW
ncbi:phage late control D family protein [Paenibacillus wynnii]|uniref:Phage late control protein n=1 Tax=Paenibacillus wynnii TaxID=268407 RepID=A0A098MGH2_9BACL|nr:phage late control protein [Paenibacillus wynnii]KGE20637.1 phage late control protein [Paenibacillus wynnii]KGE20695.1 phage late control protein [Paenibacillus wynnii]